MTSGVSGFSSVLLWNYRKVLEVLSLSGPAQSRDVIDLSSHDSADEFREYVAGLIAGGEISVEANLIVGDTAGQVAFHTDMQGGTKRNCFIVMPMAVGGALSFAALATGFEAAYPFDSKIALSGSLMVSGKPTLLVTQSAGLSGLTGIEEELGGALTITPAIAVGTYAYACSVNTASTWIKLTPVAADHTIYVQGVAVATGVQSGEIELGAAGTTTDILIIVYESAKAPRLYTLTVTRPAA